MFSDIYEFEGYRLDGQKRRLTNPSGDYLKLGPKAFDTLVVLVSRRTEVVTRDELLEAVWPDSIVEENNLTQCISALRRAFEEKPGEQRFIATIPGQGYKFVAVVHQPGENGASSPAAQGLTDSLPLPKPESLPAAGRQYLILFAVLALIVLGTSAYYIGYVLEAGGDAAAPGSVAVLPFNPMPGQTVDEAMQLGMTESLITQLGNNDRIQVRPLAATRKYSSLDRDPVSAGRELGVDAIIDGSIQIADGRVRVSAKLIRTSDGKQLWGESFNEPRKDLFSLQDSISARVADALSITLSPREGKHKTRSLEAYELYLRGRVLQRKLVKPEVDKAIGYYERAILADPTYALPQVGIAEVQRSLLLSNDAKATDVVPRAKIAAKRAVELDPELPEARSALGMIAFFYDWDWPEAEAQLKKAVELGRSDADLLVFYAHFLSNTGRSDEALESAGKARRMQPTNLLVGALEAQFYLHAGKGKEAVAKLRAVTELDEGFWLGHILLASALADEGQYNEAVKEAEIAGKLAPLQTQSEAFRAYALARSGKIAEARKILSAMLVRERDTYVPPVNIAMVYASLGDKAKAFEYLERGYTERDVHMPFLKVEHKWESLRREPEFKELLKRMKLD